MNRPLRLATRGSALALAQSRWVAGRLEARDAGVTVEIAIVRTTGDRVQDVALHQVGGKGLFTKEIEDALLVGEADLAVHSLKDLPTDLPEGLCLAAYPGIEDPRDALISREGRPLGELPSGARVGTSSLRRIAQLREARPDLVFGPVRGNIDTRLRKLEEEGWDAIVLASAGLRRLGLGERITEALSPAICVPAAGQGILAIESRAADGELNELLAALDDPWARLRATVERDALARLGGGCQVPMGVLAEPTDEGISLRGVFAAEEGAPPRRALVAGPVDAWPALVERLVAQLGGGESPEPGGPFQGMSW